MENFKKSLVIEPNQSSGRELTGKIFIGLIIGGIISILLFLISSFVGGIFTQSMGQTGEFVKNNPMLPLLLLLIGFISSFVGNLAIMLIYSLFFSKTYNKTNKTIGVILLTNAIIFVFLTPLYVIFSADINTLFVILGFHIMISIFLSTQQMESVSNPNYSSSSLLGTTLSFILMILMYSLVRKSATIGGTQNKLYLLLLMPSIIGFTLMPIGLGIREKIYYKMYEIGNNPFYTPPLKEESNKEETNKTTIINENDDINIDFN